VGGGGGGGGAKTEKVNVTFVCCGEFQKLSCEILVHSSLLHDRKLLCYFQYHTFVERHLLEGARALKFLSEARLFFNPTQRG
jgi:hypothetical protein